jgi:hypothetical protein
MGLASLTQIDRIVCLCKGIARSAWWLATVPCVLCALCARAVNFSWQHRVKTVQRTLTCSCVHDEDDGRDGHHCGESPLLALKKIRKAYMSQYLWAQGSVSGYFPTMPLLPHTTITIRELRRETANRHQTKDKRMFSIVEVCTEYKGA